MRVRVIQLPDGRPAFEVRRWLTSLRRIRSVVTQLAGQDVREYPADGAAIQKLLTFRVTGAEFRLDIVRGHLDRFVVTQELEGLPGAFDSVRQAFEDAPLVSLFG